MQGPWLIGILSQVIKQKQWRNVLQMMRGSVHFQTEPSLHMNRQEALQIVIKTIRLLSRFAYA